MAESVRALLHFLYPDENLDVGIDFNKSRPKNDNGVIDQDNGIDEDERVRDFDGNGIIDDVDLAILAFNHRDRFIFDNGAKKWRELTQLWSDAVETSPRLPSYVVKVDPRVSKKLIASGNYKVDEHGELRSVYLSEERPYPEICENQGRNYLSPLIAGDIYDIREGSHKVLRCNYSGLAESVRIEENGLPPMYIVDNHHLVYFAWQEALSMGYISKGSTLIHIDYHADDGLLGEWSDSDNLQEAADYTREKLRIYSFIAPAIKNGTVDQSWFFRVSYEMAFKFNTTGELRENTDTIRYRLKADQKYFDKYHQARESGLVTLSELFEQCGPGTVILDIDLDAFVQPPGTSYYSETNIDNLVALIKKYSDKIGVITFATSPGYADQPAAIAAVKKIVAGVTR